MIRLGVNVDHVATLRNARGEHYPDPLHAAIVAQHAGAHNITCHLREDRRHIRDHDLRRIKEGIGIPLNFEMAATDEMLKIALDVQPAAVTLVPEKRAELTTEGGLEAKQAKKNLQKFVTKLRDKDIMVSLFIEPDMKELDFFVSLGADAVEFHTGRICHALDKALSHQEKQSALEPLIAAAESAHEKGFKVHIGHGINYQNAPWFQLIPHVEEANIGHAIVAESIFCGLDAAVRSMGKLLNDEQYRP